MLVYMRWAASKANEILWKKRHATRTSRGERRQVVAVAAVRRHNHDGDDGTDNGEEDEEPYKTGARL